MRLERYSPLRRAKRREPSSPTPPRGNRVLILSTLLILSHPHYFSSSSFSFSSSTSMGMTTSSPQMYLANHCQLCHVAASCSLGFEMPWPKPLETMSFVG